MGFSADIQSLLVSGLGAVDGLLQDAVYVSVSPGVWNDTKKEYATVTTETYIKVVQSSFDQRLIDGDRIRATDAQFMMIANQLSFEPKTGDKLRKDGLDYAIEPISTDPLKIQWTLRGRR
jgi:hypothetical protein